MATIESKGFAPDTPAQTLAGVRAKAECAAKLAHHRAGQEGYSDSFTGGWPESVCEDLLRLTAGAA